MSLSIEINDASVRSAIQAVYDALGNVDPMLKEIGEVLIDSTKDRFNTETSPDGTKWEANSTVTLLNYAGRFKTKQVARIRNKKAGTGETKQLRTQIFYNVSNGELELGSPMIYAGTFHYGAKKGQYGKRTPWGDIPSREFLGLSEDDRESILAIAASYFSVA
ncbi:phage virion morphogenesis protein [Thalassolituus oleivorans]|uniref:phage virion morphogenesis protein n=1 Tax=Thalassolituus oleivorans TaxID=187493 RepID=UPI0023F42C0A|nr:phage virion morphogenesis protein [Thalassolituus oleivorans]